MIQAIQQIEECKSEPLVLKLHFNPNAERNYLTGRLANHTIKYKNQIFKIAEHLFDFSSYLFSYFESNQNTTEVIFDSLNLNVDLDVMEKTVKLLWGFKNINFMPDQFIQLLFVLEKLGNSIICYVNIVFVRICKS